MVVPVFERHNIIAQYCSRYLTTNKYIQTAKIERIESTQYQQREQTTIQDQNAYETALTDFAISKWLYRINKLMFSIALRQKVASTAIWIVSVNDLCKELSLACNLNTSSLRVYVQAIVIILQGIVISIENRLILSPSHKVSNQLTLSVPYEPSTHKAFNKPTPSAPPEPLTYKAPNQPVLSTLSVPPSYKMPNQPIILVPSGQPPHEAPNQPKPLATSGSSPYKAPNQPILSGLLTYEVPNQPTLPIHVAPN